MKTAENRRQSVLKSGLLTSFVQTLAGISEATARPRHMTVHWAAAVVLACAAVEGTARADMPAWDGKTEPVASETVDGTVWRFRIVAGNAEVAGGGPADGAMSIPRCLGGCPVTVIGADAFAGRRELTSVSIPDGVKTIGHSAFAGCEGLTWVSIPDGVTEIGEWAFASCTALKRVSIGAGTESIRHFAFGYCPNLAEIEVDAGNPHCKTDDGVLLCHGGRELVLVPRNRAGTYEVPEGVAAIHDMAFAECRELVRVVLPDSLRGIGEKAFWQCRKLEAVDFGNGVCVIGGKAFHECAKLASVELPDSVEWIGDNAFRFCGDLKTAVLGAGVRRIDTNAFADTGLETLRVPASWRGSPMLDRAKIPEGCRVVYGDE